MTGDALDKNTRRKRHRKDKTRVGNVHIVVSPENDVLPIYGITQMAQAEYALFKRKSSGTNTRDRSSRFRSDAAESSANDDRGLKCSLKKESVSCGSKKTHGKTFFDYAGQVCYSHCN